MKNTIKALERLSEDLAVLASVGGQAYGTVRDDAYNEGYASACKKVADLVARRLLEARDA